MDRDDARLVANALECRIAGERVELERLAASSLMQLSTIAAKIRRLNTDNWPPAIVAAAELMEICRRGAKICDVPAPPELQAFVDSCRRIVGEQICNRSSRRIRAAQARGRVVH